MDGKDVELRLKQNIQFLRDRSGSGQVPPEYLCQLLEEMAYFLAQAYGFTPMAGHGGPFIGAGGNPVGAGSGVGPPGPTTAVPGRLP
jgi:hypothetical protein